MRSNIIIFRGPSISLKDAKSHLGEAVYLPPAMQGDMYKAYCDYKPKAMGLIDGNFERIPSPWHKEILYLITQGVKVFGASSMGALRAAELSAFGMIGVGEIYETYNNNDLEDDDEVAILHAPAELDHIPVSDAMFDIRKTLVKAKKQKIISGDLRQKLENFYKEQFYKDRLYKAGINHFKNDHFQEIEEFENWLPFNKIEQKKADAVQLLRTIQSYDQYEISEFEFENSVYWHNLKHTIDEMVKEAVA